MKTIIGIFLFIVGTVLLYFMYSIEFGAYVQVQTIFQNALLVLVGIALLIIGGMFVSNDKLNKN